MNAADIKRFAPGAKPELVSAIVKGWGTAEAAGINTPLRVQHFMAQIATETGGLAAISESLNYTTAALRKTFGKHRISDKDCAALGRKQGRSADQESIANIVYGGAWGKKNLGNTEDGDGWLYRGGGMLQTTGRANYRKMGFEANPEKLRQPAIAFGTAVREWKNRGCNAMADRDDIVAVRKAINGGTNGLDHARVFLKKAKSVWKTVTPSVMPIAAIPVVSATPAEAPAPSPITAARPTHTEKTIRYVQMRLREAGYPEIGGIDGIMGDRTYDAIAAFRSRLRLPATERDSRAIDEELIEALKRPLKDIERVIPKERAEKPKAEIAKKSKTLKVSWWTRVLTFLGLGGGVSADAVMEFASEERLTFAQRVSGFLMDNWPILLGIGLAGSVAIGGLLLIERFRVRDVREGRHF